MRALSGRRDPVPTQRGASPEGSPGRQRIGRTGVRGAQQSQKVVLSRAPRTPRARKSSCGAPGHYKKHARGNVLHSGKQRQHRPVSGAGGESGGRGRDRRGEPGTGRDGSRSIPDPIPEPRAAPPRHHRQPPTRSPPRRRRPTSWPRWRLRPGAAVRGPSWPGSDSLAWPTSGWSPSCGPVPPRPPRWRPGSGPRTSPTTAAGSTPGSRSTAVPSPRRCRRRHRRGRPQRRPPRGLRRESTCPGWSVTSATRSTSCSTWPGPWAGRPRRIAGRWRSGSPKGLCGRWRDAKPETAECFAAAAAKLSPADLVDLIGESDEATRRNPARWFSSQAGAAMRKGKGVPS